MIELGARLADHFNGGNLVWLSGDLGAGKTTLVKGILKALGHQGAVTSPTYTLVEPYQLNCGQVMHMDLYRLNDPLELENLGVRDFLGDSLCLVEWPDRGGVWMAHPDWHIHIEYQSPESRRVTLVKKG